MSSAERSKRGRQRRKKGEMCVMLVISRDVRDILCEARWLREWDEDDRKEVQAVLQVMVDNLRHA